MNRSGKDARLQGKRVLVVEDDKSIQLGLRINLEAEGYVVEVADDGEAALGIARATAPDLIVLDIMLPKVNGLEVLAQLRAEGFASPIILLSARSAEIDKVTGLELGAEDYVAKPFSLAELLARVKAAMRRGIPYGAPTGEATAVTTEVLTFGDLAIDYAARTVTKGGVAVEMTATEFDVLRCLVDARGRALGRDVIFRRVWGPNHHGTPRTIDNFMQQLRSKLEDDPQTPRHLTTVRGVGYRFDP
jgi:DNA-binding response OmpR family regulator